MGWAVGFDPNWKRDIGYGVPAVCDHPGCGAEIDRGLSYVCGSHPYGEERGCGLFFCAPHLWYNDDGIQLCEHCVNATEEQLAAGTVPRFEPTPDTTEWINHKRTDPSWAAWREAQGMTQS
jgi:hypothetical protein